MVLLITIVMMVLFLLTIYIVFIKQLQVNSPICKKSCDFLHLKRNADILQGKKSITKQPGIPVEVTKNITSITLSWKPANASEGNVVYLLKERLSGDFNVPLSYFSDVSVL